MIGFLLAVFKFKTSSSKCYAQQQSQRIKQNRKIKKKKRIFWRMSQKIYVIFPIYALQQQQKDPRYCERGATMLCIHSIGDSCYCLVAKTCLTLFDRMDCSLPGSPVHGNSQARRLEWVAISFSRGSSQPRDRICISCMAGEFFTTEPPGKTSGTVTYLLIP